MRGARCRRRDPFSLAATSMMGTMRGGHDTPQPEMAASPSAPVEYCLGGCKNRTMFHFPLYVRELEQNEKVLAT